jgi:DNA helicase HerA-like ATPase
MSKTDDFSNFIQTGYTFKSDSILLGGGMLDGEPVPGLQVRAPLRTFNRHGLVSGATGTGKTKTLQNLAERLSENGVSVLLMDVKGDLSGLAKPGNPHPKIDERHEAIGSAWDPTGFPVELMTISKEKGVRLRATVSEFGPVLFSKILGVNDTQAGAISLVFKYCDDNQMPLLDLKDFRKTLHYLTNEGKEEISGEYGRIATSTTGAILRRVVEIEEQDADRFFGERSFDVQDLLRTDSTGKGFIHIMRLVDIQDRPKLFSTFMLCLLAEIYSTFPEVGDKENPKLVLFIDEAHLVFDEATKSLMQQIETIVKLIRSKGVGLFFCTQLPTDIPDEVLSQLGMKVQHALRAFTAKDRKAIKLTAENYPISPYYKTDEVLTKLGIGEALVTVLNEKGIPTPLVHTLLTAPRSRMDVLTQAEQDAVRKASALAPKYNERIDRNSAYEMLTEKLAQAQKDAEEKVAADLNKSMADRGRSTSTGRSSSRSRKKESTFDKIAKSRVVNTIARELTRGLLGVLGGKR